MNRPLVWAASAFTAGIWASGADHHAAWWIGGMLVTLVAIWFLPRPLPYRDGVPIALVFLLAGVALEINQRPMRHGDSLSRHNRQHPDSIYRIEGTVMDAPIYTADLDYAPVRLHADRVEVGGMQLEARGGVIVRWSDPRRPLHTGERIRVQGKLDPVLGEVNLGIGGAEDYYRTLGYHSALRTRGDTIQWLSRPVWSIGYWASRLRHWQADVFARTAPADIQVFLRAVWLGDRATYSEEAYRPYLETGTAHILSVSGVHVGIVYLSLHWALRGIIRNRKQRNAMVLLAVVLFALMTGARPPILRAAIMIGLYLWAEFLEREPDAPTALSIAALLFLGANPGLLWDTAFILSFGSLASILVFSEAIAHRLTQVPLIFRQNVATTLGVSILPLPLAAHFFHLVPVLGSVCNLMVIPLLTGVLWLCMLVLLLAPFSTAVASLFGHAAAPLIYLIEWIAVYFAQLPLAFITVTSPTLIAGLLYVAAAVGLARLLFEPERARHWTRFSLTAALLAWLLWRPLFPPATLDFLDVGHGDSAFIRTPGGTTLLVDAGDKSDYLDMGKRVVTTWLLAHGIDQIDYMVITHADRDHIGGAISVMRQIDIGEVILWPKSSTNVLELALLEACAEQDVPVRRVRTSESIAAAGATVSVIHPTLDSNLRGVNNQSVVLQIEWPGLSALLSGDIEVEAERELLPRLQPVDVLKVPHHGSHTSSSATFLDAVSPTIAVVSTRASARREAMGREVVPRYTERHIALYRTDYHGGIQVRQRGDQLVVKSARAQRGYSLDPAAQ
ncbi:MAG: DNA internalization-related competence protein ComEC/Rec2 [Candidatus Hydrogenedentes bacterium]|nr:DNA internalization-related competence protein ComEC/Rec2 [Candidatus Hydrogenedentota bacterium]